MKTIIKIILIVLMVALNSLVAISKSGNTLATPSIIIVSGPTVRLPGISEATRIQLTGVPSTKPVRWLRQGGGIVGEGPTYSVTEAGTYIAQANLSTVPDNPVWVPQTSIGINDLSHSITVTGPAAIDPMVGSTQLCVTSNGAAYIKSISWLRNGSVEWPSSFVSTCRVASVPGNYTAQITYEYGGTLGNGMLLAPPTGPTSNSLPTVGERVTLITQAIAINAGKHSPAVAVFQTTYDPVSPPPVLKVSNFSIFNKVRLLKKGSSLIFQLSGPTINAHGPGTYLLSGDLSPGYGGHTGVYSREIVITKGSIPVPFLGTDGGTELTYQDQELKLITHENYNAGYTWYFNDVPISNATSFSLNVFKPGTYKVNACATHPDGQTECKMSAILTITGEVLKVNSVVKKTSLVEGITTVQQMNNLPKEQINHSITYFDGLVRPLQQIAHKSSPAGKDVTSIMAYDELGREQRKYLPFVSVYADGKYRYINPANPVPLQAFYQAQSDGIANTNYPFAETVFEPSPLNRIKEQGAPGEDWQLSAGHTTRFTYATHKASASLLIWKEDAQGLVATEKYATGSLSVMEVTDENNNKQREFKDKAGNTVVTEIPGEAGQWFRTYNVYDDMNRLRYILPPNIVHAVAGNSTPSISATTLQRECFSYKYDERGRMIMKQIPGAGAVLFVYDMLDRPVLSQTANQRLAQRWTFTKYDALDRLVLTGEISLAGDQAAATQAVASFYATLSTNSLLRYEETGGPVHGYTNRSFPVLTNEFQAYSVLYYDNYNFLTQFGSAYQFTPEASLGLTANSPDTKTLPTGNKTLILGTTDYLKTVTFYDKRYRPIQVVTDNHLGGIDRTSNAIDFTGKIIKAKMVHNGLQTVIVDHEFTYDHAGRKLKVFHALSNGPRVLLGDYRYNELGQLVEKNIHSTDGNTFLQSLDYAYNIRGWLEKVNPSETESNATYPDQYGFELAYTAKPSTAITDFQPAFNGNITAFTEVRPATDDAGTPFKSTYSYRYDARDQLVQANYYQLSNPLKNGWYDMPAIKYDLNGNIQVLRRKGLTKNGIPGLIDDLNYSYSGNQLIQVDDLADQTKGFVNK